MIDLNITDKEMREYKKKFLGMEVESSLEESIKKGIELGIPIAYFIKTSIVNEGNFRDFRDIGDELYNDLEMHFSGKLNTFEDVEEEPDDSDLLLLGIGDAKEVESTTEVDTDVRESEDEVISSEKEDGNLKRKTFLILALLMVSLFVFSGIAFANEADFIFDSDTGTITGYTGPGGDVMIPSQIGGVSVTSIGYGAFGGCTSLTSVTIPNSVTSIGDFAFAYSSLISVTIPDSVTSIGDFAFACSSLTSVTIPDSLISLGDGAFAGCLGLTSINVAVNNSIYSSYEGVLFDKNKTTLIQCPSGKTGDCIIPDSVTRISTHAFIFCTELNGIVIPNSVTDIEDFAFFACLTNIILPSNMTSINKNAFEECTNSNIIVQDGNTNINGFNSDLAMNLISFNPNTGTIEKCQGAGRTLIIPSQINGVNVTDIGYKACFQNMYIRNLIISEGITNIQEGAFSECKHLITVTLPNTLTDIGFGAFFYCPALESINIPNSVKNIGNNAFGACLSLTNINISSSICNIGDNAFRANTKLSHVTIGTESEIGDIHIGNYAFNSCPDLTVLNLGKNVTSIGEGAFSHCTGLTNVTIPDSVTSISGATFFECSNLITVTIPDNVTDIGQCAFYECRNLSNITIPNSVKVIHAQAFVRCNLTSITIPESVTDIGFLTFIGCDNLEKITFLNKNTIIGFYEEEIYGHSSLKEAPEGQIEELIWATIPHETVIRGYVPSTAKKYADKYNRNFEDITPKGTVTIHYQDSEGNILKDSDIYTNVKGTQTYTAPDIEGYTKPLIDSIEITITTEGQEENHTLIYSKNEIPNTPPIITLLGDNPTNITVGETFNEPGATAIDLEDGDLTDSIITTGTVDTATVGTYTITYTVTDSGGLTDTKTRTVNVSAVPVLGLNIAPNPITLIIGDTQQVKGILKRTDNSTEDVTNLTNWNINPGDKATISNTGLLQALAAGECTLEAIYNHWNGTEMVVYSDNAQVIITDPTQPVEPVEPEPSNPSVQPPSLINPGSSGGYSSSTTKTIEPKEPEKPVINPLELENVFVARLPESTTIIDAVAVIELTGESTIPIETPRLKQGQEYRAYYYNADKQKWIALASYANNNKVEFAGDIKEGYVAVFAVDQPIFEDLKPKTDIEVVINRLNGLVITEGYPGNGNIRTFAPERPITGVELSTMQARVLGMVQPGQQRLYDILPVYQPVEDVVWYKPYIDSVKPLLPVTEGQTVTATEAVSSIKQLQKIIETKTEDGFKGKLSTPENEVITRADASRLILSLIEGLGW